MAISIKEMNHIKKVADHHLQVRDNPNIEDFVKAIAKADFTRTITPEVVIELVHELTLESEHSARFESAAYRFMAMAEDEAERANENLDHVQNLTMLLRRLCRMVPGGDKNAAVQQAKDYLKRKGLNPSVLREKV